MGVSPAGGGVQSSPVLLWAVLYRTGGFTPVHSFFGNHKHTKCYLLSDALDSGFRYINIRVKLEPWALLEGMENSREGP